MTRTPDGSHQGEPIGPTLQRGATMAERYRDHLIFVRAVLDPERHLWTVSAHIQFNEHPGIFRDISLPKPTALFETQKGAESYMVRQAKQWIDDRLGKPERQGLYRRFATGSFWRALLSILAIFGAKPNEGDSN